MNKNELLNDISNLQLEWNKLLDNKCMTKRAICDLCIPFRDKYKLTDKQTLCIARNEVDIPTINEWLSENND